MDKSSKKPDAKVVAASDSSPTKPDKKGKRRVEESLEKYASVKKQSKVSFAPLLKKKVEMNSSEDDSVSESDEEKLPASGIKNGSLVYTKKQELSDDTSDSDSSSGEEMDIFVTKKKSPTVPPGSDSDSSSDEETTVVTIKKPTAAASKKKPVSSDSSAGSDSDSSSDEEMKPTAAVPQKKLMSNDNSSGSDSDGNSDEGMVIAANINKPIAAAAQKKPVSRGSSSESGSDSSLDERIKGKAAATSKIDSDSNDDFSDSSEEEKDAEVKMKDVPSANGNDKQPDTKSDKPITSACQTQSSGPKTVFLENLSFQVGQDDVADFFKEAQVVNLRLEAADDGSFRGCGHVEFATEAAAKKALEINGQMFLGRPEKPEFAREWGSTPQRGKENTSSQKAGQGQSQTIYVKGFDKSLDEYQVKSSLEKHFQSCGEISRISILKDCVTGASKGIAFMDFKDQDGARKATKLNGSDLGGCILNVDEARSRGDSRDGDMNNSSTKRGGSDQRRTIYVKGFDKSLDAYQIRSSLEEHFQKCGEIIRVSIPKDNETGALRGMAFLDLKDQDSVSRALEFNGSDLGGYTLTVNIARNRGDSHDGSWSGGRSGGRGKSGGGRCEGWLSGRGGGGGRGRGGGGWELRNT